MSRLPVLALMLTLPAAAAAAVPSSGPVLLGYKDTVLTTGVCQTLKCEFSDQNPTKSGKAYYYDGKDAMLGVYRDGKMNIIAAHLLTAERGMSAAFKAGLVKFMRGFVGVKWTDTMTTQCIKAPVGRVFYTGKTASGIKFGIRCAVSDGGVVFMVRDLKWSESMLDMPDTPKPAPATKPDDLGIIDSKPTAMVGSSKMYRDSRGASFNGTAERAYTAPEARLHCLSRIALTAGTTVTEEAGPTYPRYAELGWEWGTYVKWGGTVRPVTCVVRGQVTRVSF